MNKTFFVILISVFAFIGINTYFYINIYNRQLNFQTGLLTLQTQSCGSTIEQEGMNFENELNYIPYVDDFSRLFTDDGVRERGAENLQKLYTRYSKLIEKVTVFDNQNNVYSLILDLKNNFVSDYYESQQQFNLLDRDQLIREGGIYRLVMPDFEHTGKVHSNIIVDLNFSQFVNAVFEQYLLENTTWPWLVSEEGELIASAGKNIQIEHQDLERISHEILPGNEGSFVHTIEVDSIPTRVVSVYYPVRLIKRDLAVVFSMKTDIFLRSIIIKIIIISLCSLVLLVLLLYVHFRVIRVKSEHDDSLRISGETLTNTMDALPVSVILAAENGHIQLMNREAREMIFSDSSASHPNYNLKDLGLEKTSSGMDDSIYQRLLGPGELVAIPRGKGKVHLFKNEQVVRIGQVNTKIIMLFDISILEKSRNLDQMARMAKNELLESMKQEIDVPLDHIKEELAKLRGNQLEPSHRICVEAIQKSRDMLSNLVNAFTEFTRQDARKAVLEEIPFSLRTEINMALDPLKNLAGQSETSIITKIRDDVPDQITGDPFRFRNVIGNLVSISIELTRNGRILISAEILEHHPEYLKIQFRIEDSGTGLDPQQIGILQDPGARPVPENLEKTVTRISLARQHVELMNGQLWIESTSSISTNPDHPGIRFLFYIEIPYGKSTEISFTDVKKLEDIQCLVLTQRKHSLETDHFAPLKDLGLNLKYLIYRKDNMDSVFKLVSEKSSGIHLLVIIDSPDEDGFMLAGKLNEQELTSGIIKIVLSSNPGPENFKKYEETGIDHYIDEPSGYDRFIEIISSHFPEIPAREMRNAPKGSKAGPDISILLAEDNLFNRRIAQALFKSLGYEIDMARNGKEALSMLEQKSYDIIFMDLLMPEMDGLEATAAIRKKGDNTPVVALTAVDDNETRKAAGDNGISEYLLKPVTAEKLSEILSAYFNNSG